MSQAEESRKLYLGDLKVGDRFSSSHAQMTEEGILAFAKAYDPQIFHTDPGAAEQTFFQGLAASGWHTSAVTMRLLVDSLPLAGGVIGAGGEISWPSPTRPGDMLYVESEIIEIHPSRSKPDQGIVVAESRTLTDKGELRQVFRSKLLVFRRQQ